MPLVILYTKPSEFRGVLTIVDALGNDVMVACQKFHAAELHYASLRLHTLRL